MFIAILSIATFLMIIASILFFPRIQLGRFQTDTYWIVAVIGALLVIVTGTLTPQEAYVGLFATSQMNPINILILFLSMTILSIFLDEVGFFKYLAYLAQEKAKNSQMSVFLSLYITVSILTIFTSNDIIILTFTPFICMFAKNTNINPIPYLIAEFVAANTWSMMLLIGNPTNIYLATMYNIGFVEYVSIMFLPTVMTGLISLGLLLLVFRNELKKPLQKEIHSFQIHNRFYLIVGLIHLGFATIMLAISHYIGLSMWLIALVSVISLCVFIIIYRLITHHKEPILGFTLRRTPWTLVPFVVSMFILVAALSKYHITDAINQLLGSTSLILNYGISSFLMANVMNNIPMSVMYAQIIQPLLGDELMKGVYAAIIGSNIGAYLTPIGALAGIMWMSILKKEHVQLGFAGFIKQNALISMMSLLIALFGLFLILG